MPLPGEGMKEGRRLLVVLAAEKIVRETTGEANTLKQRFDDRRAIMVPLYRNLRLVCKPTTLRKGKIHEVLSPRESLWVG